MFFPKGIKEGKLIVELSSCRKSWVFPTPCPHMYPSIPSSIQDQVLSYSTAVFPIAYLELRRVVLRNDPPRICNVSAIGLPGLLEEGE